MQAKKKAAKAMNVIMKEVAKKAMKIGGKGKGQRTEDKSVDAKGPWVTKLVYECEGGEGHEVRESDLHKDKLKNQREEGCI